MATIVDVLGMGIPTLIYFGIWIVLAMLVIVPMVAKTKASKAMYMNSIVFGFVFGMLVLMIPGVPDMVINLLGSFG